MDENQILGIQTKDYFVRMKEENNQIGGLTHP